MDCSISFIFELANIKLNILKSKNHNANYKHNSNRDISMRRNVIFSIQEFKKYI